MCFPISERLAASLHAAEMGFEVRWRVDPILHVEGWQGMYAQFLADAAQVGHRPTRITLGTYREAQPTLARFAEGWGLPPMEWEPPRLTKDGPHRRLAAHERAAIYAHLARASGDA
jgi:hypothetical protein